MLHVKIKYLILRSRYGDSYLDMYELPIMFKSFLIPQTGVTYFFPGSFFPMIIDK